MTGRSTWAAASADRASTAMTQDETLHYWQTMRKAMEAAEKDGEVSADELERAEKELEKVTHEHVEHIDTALGRKEQELLEV